VAEKGREAAGVPEDLGRRRKAGGAIRLPGDVRTFGEKGSDAFFFLGKGRDVGFREAVRITRNGQSKARKLYGVEGIDRKPAALIGHAQVFEQGFHACAAYHVHR